MTMAFNPVTGLLNTAVYPTTPANETAARQQPMDLFYQLRDYLNTPLAWTIPTLLNGWINFGGGFATAGYSKDIFGKVQLKGVIKSGVATSGAVLFTLPAGYRPLEQHVFSVVSNDAFGEVQIFPNGDVKIIIGTNVSLSLSNIIFWSEQ